VSSTVGKAGGDGHWGGRWVVGKGEVRERNRVRGRGSYKRKKRRKHRGALNPDARLRIEHIVGRLSGFGEHGRVSVFGEQDYGKTHNRLCIFAGIFCL